MIERQALFEMWESEWRCFPWETVKRLSFDPKFDTLDKLREKLHTIATHRMEK